MCIKQTAPTPSTGEALGAASSASKGAVAPSSGHANVPFVATLATIVVAVGIHFGLTSAGAIDVSLKLPSIMHLCVLAAYCALGTAIGGLGHTALLWLARGNGRRGNRLLDAFIVVYGAASLFVPYALPMATGGQANMSVALMLWVQYWKALDILAGTAPSVVTERPFHLLLHLACLVEYRTTPVVAGKAALEPLPAGARLDAFKAVVFTAVTFSAAASAAEFAPSERVLRLALGGAAGWLSTAASVYLRVWLIYGMLKLMADLNCLALALLGYHPAVVFRAPLTASTSPTDFWSRRWNMLVRGLFHRSVFAPLRNRGVAGPLAALSAFAVSGLFHEYAFASASRGAGLGRNLVFFLVQAVFCTAELLLTKAPFAQRLLAGASPFVSDSARVLLTTLLLVPFSPLFMAPLEANNTIDAMLTCIVRVRVAIA